jgi:hypothetical protein
MRGIWLLAVMLASALTGCGARPGDAAAVNPAMVMSPEQITAKHGMAISVFAFENRDRRGWPNDEAHCRLIRFLQNHGVPVGS